jgi:hypothetical protein
MQDLRNHPDYREAVENSFLQGAITEQQRDELLKPKYHELIAEAVNEFKSQLSCDNVDLFLEQSK